MHPCDFYASNSGDFLCPVTHCCACHHLGVTTHDWDSGSPPSCPLQRCLLLPPIHQGTVVQRSCCLDSYRRQCTIPGVCTCEALQQQQRPAATTPGSPTTDSQGPRNVNHMMTQPARQLPTVDAAQLLATHGHRIDPSNASFKQHRCCTATLQGSPARSCFVSPTAGGEHSANLVA